MKIAVRKRRAPSIIIVSLVDILTILLGGVALDLATTRRPWGHAHSGLLGLVSGLALLTKVSAWPVAAVLVVWLLWKRSGAARSVKRFLTNPTSPVRQIAVQLRTLGVLGVQPGGFAVHR